jgi:hypothetical protein
VEVEHGLLELTNQARTRRAGDQVLVEDTHEEELRDGIEIVGVTSLLADTQDATRTSSF